MYFVADSGKKKKDQISYVYVLIKTVHFSEENILNTDKCHYQNFINIQFNTKI